VGLDFYPWKEMTMQMQQSEPWMRLNGMVELSLWRNQNLESHEALCASL
jgi:hypothetical protein